jgi:glycosyltransferase involved in cell wall biosynthesis
VTSDLPWARSELSDEDALVVPVDEAAVADAVESVLTRPELASSLARNGRSLAERERSQQAALERLGALYGEVAA